MRYRRFGSTPLEVSEIGFGCSRLGGIFTRAADRGEARDLLRTAIDEGINFFDTADMYSQGESEALLGEAVRARRAQVVLASKGGYRLPGQRRLAARIKPLLRPVIHALGLKRQRLPAGIAGALSQDFTPRYLFAAVEGSLRRLRTDYLDLYQLHSPSAAFLQSAEAAETIEALETLRRQGKIRWYGIAADTVQDADTALRCHPGIASLQLPFGLLEPEAQHTLLERAMAHGIGVIARGCYGGGFLKDSLSDDERKAATPDWQRIVACHQEAAEMGRPTLEAALQFAVATPGISVTLVGMRTRGHLTANLRHYAAPPLTAHQYARLANVWDSSQSGKTAYPHASA